MRRLGRKVDLDPMLVMNTGPCSAARLARVTSWLNSRLETVVTVMAACPAD